MLRIGALLILIFSGAAQAAAPLNACHEVFAHAAPEIQTKIVEGSNLLAITPENYASYESHITTLNTHFQTADPAPVSFASRYQVTDKLPKFMPFRKSRDGVYEMRGFGARSRYFRVSEQNGALKWQGVDKPVDPEWTQGFLFINEAHPAKVQINRDKIVGEIAENTGEASRTVNDQLGSPKERSDNAKSSLHEAAKKIVEMFEHNERFSIESLEALHAIAARGTIQTKNGDLGLGIIRGSQPRYVNSAEGPVFADMRQLSVRMGDQTIMSYTAPQNVRAQLELLLKRINRIDPHARPEEVAAIFQKFLMIHPFIDGNGRMSRLLLQFMQLKMQTAPTKLSQQAAYMAYYLTPNELAQLIFGYSEIKMLDVVEGH